MSLGSRLLSRSRPEKICEHRTVAGAADLDRLGRGFPFDRDGVARERKGGWPRWRGVTSGLARFQAFDDQVKDIRAGRRHAPGDASIVTEHDARNPGSAGADAAEARRLEPDEVPDARCAELQMRIVGEERLLNEIGERVRDVRVNADGNVYVVTDEDDGKIWRIEAPKAP